MAGHQGLWNTERCGECGYLLCGLPQPWRCPECGRAYAGGDVVLLGWGAGLKANVGNTRDRWSPVLALLTAVSNVALTVGLQWQAGAILSGALLAAMLALVVWDLARRLRNRWLRLEGVKTLAQVRLGPGGFAQRDGFGPVKWRRWEQRTIVEIQRLARRLYRVQVRREGSYWRSAWPLADLEFEGTPEQVGALRRAVRRFTAETAETAERVLREGWAVNRP